MKKEVIPEIIIALLVLLFLYASFSKFFNMPGFVASMGKQPFPRWMQEVIVWTLPGSEAIIAVLLVPRRTRQFGLYAFSILMGLFTLYIAAILLHAFPYVPCTCGGVISRLRWSQHFIFNLFFLSLAISGIRLNIFHARNQVSTAGPDKTGHLNSIKK